MSIRRVLLEGNYEIVHETLSSLKNTKENYDFLCDFHTECEVKGISLDPKIVQLIFDFVIEYRLKYSDEHGIPEKYEENISARVKFLEQIICDYLNHNYENPVEKFVILKCVAKTLKPIKNYSLKVPWQDIQFMICIFVAVKSNRKRDQYKFIDDFFQLVVHEDLIRDVLQLVLNCLEENSVDNGKWRKFYNTHAILQMYYLLLKTAYYFKFINRKSVIRDKASYRALQVIGECCQQMSKLRYEGFDDDSYPMSDVRLFSTVLSHERNKLSHFKELLSEKQREIIGEINEELLNVERLGLFILDMIQMVRKEIERIVVEEYKVLIENKDVQQLFERVNDVNIQNVILPLIDMEYPSQFMDKEIEILSKCGLIDNFTNIFLNDISEQNKTSYCLNDKSFNIFGFIQWFKKNCQRPVECIKNKLNAITPKPFIDVTTSAEVFVKLLPKSAQERYLKWFEKFKKTHDASVANSNLNFSRDDSMIEEFLEMIRFNISNPKEKEEFNKLEYILLKKRSLILEYKFYKDLKSVISDWPKDNEHQKVTERLISSYNDPLNLFVTNAQKNISDYENVDIFLKKINFKNRAQIVDAVRKCAFEDLTKSLQSSFCILNKDPNLDFSKIFHKVTTELSSDYNILDFTALRDLKNYLGSIYSKLETNELIYEINILDCLEILKKIDIKLSQDHNYLDFDCAIPVARNLRNCLAHGDIYNEIFCSNFKEIVQSHLRVLSKSYKNIKQIGFWRPDDLETVEKDFDKHRKWAGEVWETLNLKTNSKKLEEVETFKVRDYNNRSVVHYNLRNKDNTFLMYLIEQVTLKSNFQKNKIFERMLEESRNNNSTDYGTFDFFIDKFVDEPKLHEKRLVLCGILCFRCENSEIFRKVYLTSGKIEVNTILLGMAMAHNLLEITDFLIEQILNDGNFEVILEEAIDNENHHLISILLETISDNSSKHRINWPNLVIKSAEKGNIEVLDLLSKNSGSLNSENRNLLIKTAINFNSNTNVCKLIIERYLSPMSKEESELLLHMCCFNERYKILRYLLDEVIPDTHWNEIKNLILISCFNINSIEIVEYLIGKCAYFDYKSLDEYLPFFVSSKIVEVLFDRFGCLTLHQNPRKMTYVRNKDVAEVFHSRGYSLDWFKIDSLPLEFILKKYPGREIDFKKLRFFLGRSSSEVIPLLFQFLKDHKIEIRLSELPKFVAGTRTRKLNWLWQLDWKEPDQRDFDYIIANAIIFKYLTYVRIALRKGVNLNVNEGLKKFTFVAVDQKQHQILDLYQEHGVDLNMKYYGNTLLDIAIEKGKGHITNSMRVLSKFGITSDYGIDFHNLNPQDMLLFGVLKKNLKLIQDALSSGADINFKYKKYRYGTILHLTAYNIELRESVVRDFILDLKIDTFIKDSDGYLAFDLDLIYEPVVRISKNQKLSPFHLFWAGVVRDDLDLMEEALRKGADVNSYCVGIVKSTALHIFASDGPLKAVEFLLKKGADPLKTNSSHEYPIDMAIYHDNCDIFKLLFSKNVDLVKSFELAVLANSVEIVRFLLEKGVDVNTKIYKSYSAIEIACKNSNNKALQLAKVLIEYKINLNNSDINTAWQNGNYDLAKLILYKINNYPKTVQEFEIAIENGMNINLAPESDLRTYLHLACYFKDKEIVKFLLENGANFLQNDLNGKNPVTIALEGKGELKKLFFKPLLLKFYSMWSKYPSKEFIDFYNINPELDIDYIIVFWFDIILRVSGIFDKTDIENSTPFENLASGLWHNNINFIQKAVDSGVEINHLLRELVFVVFVLNHNNDNLCKTLEFVEMNGGSIVGSTADVKKLSRKLLDIAVPMLYKFPMHPHLGKAVESYNSGFVFQK